MRKIQMVALIFTVGLMVSNAQAQGTASVPFGGTKAAPAPEQNAQKTETPPAAPADDWDKADEAASAVTSDDGCLLGNGVMRKSLTNFLEIGYRANGLGGDGLKRQDSQGMYLRDDLYLSFMGCDPKEQGQVFQDFGPYGFGEVGWKFSGYNDRIKRANPANARLEANIAHGLVGAGLFTVLNVADTYHRLSVAGGGSFSSQYGPEGAVFHQEYRGWFWRDKGTDRPTYNLALFNRRIELREELTLVTGDDQAKALDLEVAVLWSPKQFYDINLRFGPSYGYHLLREPTWGAASANLPNETPNQSTGRGSSVGGIFEISKVHTFGTNGATLFVNGGYNVEFDEGGISGGFRFNF